MSAAGLVLKLAADLGISVVALDGDLDVQAASRPPDVILDLLAANKQELLDFLSPGRNGWSADDWRAYYDERAAANDFLHALRPCEAAARAFDCCVSHWLDQHPPSCTLGLCAGCDGGSTTYDPLTPYGTGPSVAWLHKNCWPVWYAGRKAAAETALTTLGVGIAAPAGNEA